MKVCKGVFGLIIMIVILIGCTGQPKPGSESIKNIISSILNRQVEGWNQGDIEEFMSGYYQSDSLRFASGASVTYGWQLVLDRYKSRYNDKSAMGMLTFTDIDITILSKDAALAFGKWKLKRNEDESSGLFTLIFKKTGQGWRVVHDHSSSATGN